MKTQGGILTHGHLIGLGGHDKDEQDGEEVNSKQREHLQANSVSRKTEKLGKGDYRKEKNVKKKNFNL